MQTEHLMHYAVCHLHCTHKDEQIEDQLSHIAPYHRDRACVSRNNGRACGEHAENDAGKHDDRALQTNSGIAFKETLADAA